MTIYVITETETNKMLGCYTDKAKAEEVAETERVFCHKSCYVEAMSGDEFLARG